MAHSTITYRHDTDMNTQGQLFETEAPKPPPPQTVNAKTITPEERAAIIERGDRAKAEIEATLHTSAIDLDNLRRVASAFFAEATDGKVYKRRPGVSIRLPVDGDPPATLIIAPGWDSRKKVVNTASVRLELKVIRMADQEIPTVELAVVLEDRREPNLMCWSLKWPEGAKRLTHTVAAFLVEPTATFAKASDHCCMCGHPLTDEISRARGIGPECHAYVTSIRRAIERGILSESDVKVQSR